MSKIRFSSFFALLQGIYYLATGICSKGRISRVYMAESLVEAGLIALWLTGLIMLKLTHRNGATHRF